MNNEEVLIAVDELVLAKKGKTLSNIDRIILRGSCQEKTYKEIYKDYKNCTESPREFGYIERGKGPKLWKLLSEVLEVEVDKNNFIGAVERAWRLYNEERSNIDNIKDIEQSSSSYISEAEIERKNGLSTESTLIDSNEEHCFDSTDKYQPINPYTLVAQSKPETHMNDNQDLDNGLMMPLELTKIRNQELLSGVEVTGNLEVEDLIQKAKPGGSVKQKMATNLKAENVKLGNLTQEC